MLAERVRVNAPWEMEPTVTRYEPEKVVFAPTTKFVQFKALPKVIFPRLCILSHIIPLVENVVVVDGPHVKPVEIIVPEVYVIVAPKHSQALALAKVMVLLPPSKTKLECKTLPLGELLDVEKVAVPEAPVIVMVC